MSEFWEPTEEEKLKFIEESFRHLDSITKGILDFGKSPEESIVDEILRSAHTLKGSGSMMSLTSLTRLSSSLEEAFGLIKKKNVEFNSDFEDILLKNVDLIKESLDRFMAGKDDFAAGSRPDVLEDFLKNVRFKIREKLFAEFPNLTSEITEVMSNLQINQLLEGKKQGNKIYEISLPSKKEDFQLIDRLNNSLKMLGKVICSSGISKIPEGFDFYFKFILSTDAGIEEVEKFIPLPNIQIARLGIPGEIAEAEAEKPLTPEEEAEKEKFLDEVREIFISDSQEKIQELTTGLLELEKNPDSKELIDSIFRVAHSLKGSGSSFGYPTVTKLGHSMEDILDKARKRELRITENLIDLFFQCLDALKEVYTDAREGRPDRNIIPPVVEKLKVVLEAKEVPVEAAEAGIAVVPVKIFKPEEALRVSLSKLDRMANLVGEIATIQNSQEEELKKLERLISFSRDSRREIAKLLADIKEDKAMREIFSNSKFSFVFQLIEKILNFVSEDGDNLFRRLYNANLRRDASLKSLQEEVLKVRMVPVSKLFESYPRMIRDISKSQGKDIRLELEGEKTELDRRILEEITDPMMHLVRNAVDHGIEMPEERKKRGKPPYGTIKLSATTKGNQVVIEISDDGKGIDRNKVRQKALEGGFLKEGASSQVSDDEVLNFIFMPGFSTADKVTTISGRGVGMDVVKNQIEKLRGSIEIETSMEKGTIFRLKVPLTMVSINVLVVEAGAGQIFCLPSIFIDEVTVVNINDIMQTGDKLAVEEEGKLMNLAYLGSLLGIEGEINVPDGGNLLAVVVRSLERRFGLIIDRIIGHQDVVARGLGGILKGSVNFAGAAVLGTGELALILDVPEIIKLLSEYSVVSSAEIKIGIENEGQAGPSILLVEDSFVSRQLTKTMLEDFGFEVHAASDGEEAVRILDEQKFDLVITDVQMPRMDGINLIKYLKGSKRFKRLPVIIMSIFSDQELIKKGLEAGASSYIRKGTMTRKEIVDIINKFVPKPAL
ncbi:MAG: Hpt domain-containing protein [Firmicutes bacterium]|nr:Hpt domain-containing protein [Bacillota bacterium]